MKSGRYTLNTVTGGTTESQTQSLCQDEGEARVCRGSRCLVWMTVCLGIICVLLLVFIILHHISITAERESLFKSNKNTVEEFNQTINRSQDENTNQMTEKDQVKNNFNSLSQKNLEPKTSAKDLTDEKIQLQNYLNSLSQKNLELETRVKDLTAKKSQLQGSVDDLNKKKQELERKVTSLSEELKKEKSKQGNLCGPVRLFKSNELKSWSESRQYCRDHGGDLVIIDTEEKQKSISSLIKERVWIGLTDIENEGNMTWVDNSTLRQGFWLSGEPNDQGGSEDCIELMPENPVLNNWNDLPCSLKRKGICEK
ncbi:CD209 antigen-like protein C isoform X1 [Megalobrama amblycephala]|uniref:CD209 antigen-like protein C isoform X1 n=1 Tax=Megalobrama amblycephala TaxID=75352 RepID=UPI002013FCF1|nr:CD209 antigen-like protein C isoform X1 [Megalobrama amblycephala]